jgi:ABC-type nitrate/sulfonate/bicarbonate transport system ATPase subunit
MPARLATERLSRRFDDLSVLEDVELEVGAGEFVSVIGPSGCGKSTLLGILAGLIPPTGGRVLLDGVEPASLLGRVGYMPQRDLLMPWRTVLRNTTLAMEVAGVPGQEARRAALAEFPRFGLDGFERHWPASLSGGKRQRAALLRTFLAGRDVVLLDEPFGALDALTRQSMQAWLLRIWREDAKTILFVTHDVDEAAYLSDRVYVMSPRPGRVVEGVEVRLPRPRTEETTLSPEFLEVRRRLLEPLRRAMPDGVPGGSAPRPPWRCCSWSPGSSTRRRPASASRPSRRRRRSSPRSTRTASCCCRTAS